MDYSCFWNEIEIEKTKPFWVTDANDAKLMTYLRNQTNLEQCFLDALSFASGIAEIRGRILDVGAGVAWSSAIISRNTDVENVIATDISEHRLKQIAPIVIDQMQGEKDKIETVLGNFESLEFASQSFDVVVFVQSLYMFGDLNAVLGKVSRILKKCGLVIVACERIMMPYKPLNSEYYLGKLRRIYKSRADASGNHGYRDHEYRKSIRKCGMQYYFQLLNYPVYLDMKTNAGNYFGINNGILP